MLAETNLYFGEQSHQFVFMYDITNMHLANYNFYQSINQSIHGQYLLCGRLSLHMQLRVNISSSYFYIN